jgi:hypothetical protein
MVLKAKLLSGSGTQFEGLTGLSIVVLKAQIYHAKEIQKELDRGKRD